MDMPVPLDHRVDPTSDPTSKLVISYKLQVQYPAPASSLAELPPAASPQLGRWICQQGLRSARMRCLLLVLAAARVLLLLCCCFGNGCSSCFLTFGHISYWYDNSRASYYYYYCCIYLLSVQSPAPASSLAEPPPAASPQLRRWVCQQGLRSARIRGLLLVLAAASAAAAAASATAALLAFLRLVTFRTGMIILELATTTTTAVSIFYLCSLQPRQAA